MFARLHIISNGWRYYSNFLDQKNKAQRDT